MVFNATLTIFQLYCPRPTKLLCYLTLILTEYSAVIWDPHTVENISKLEMIQRRAARMVYADYQTTSSVSTMLNQLSSIETVSDFGQVDVYLCIL